MGYTLDLEKIQRDVRQFRLKHRNMSADELADWYIRDAALYCAGVGAVSHLADVVPVAGQIAGLVGLGADFSLTLKRQSQLVVEIATIYDSAPTPPTALVAVLGVLGIGFGVGGVKAAAVKGAVTAAKAGLKGAALKFVKVVAKNLGFTFTKKVFLRWVPVIGAPIGGALNYAATLSIGKTAKAFYSGKPVGVWQPTTDEELSLLRADIAMAWADGRLSEQERRAIGRRLSKSSLDAEAKQIIRSEITKPHAPEEIVIALQSAEAKTLLLDYVLNVAAVDKEINEAETALIQKFAESLGVPIEETGKKTAERQERLQRKRRVSRRKKSGGDGYAKKTGS